jgi:hypothetical protein
MKLLISDFKSVSFHDSPIRSVEERDDYIRISLDFGLIRPPLKEAEGQKCLIRDCILECINVSRNEKEEWHDTVKPSPHSTPNHPLEEIQSEKVTNQYIEFGGKSGINWGVWRIMAGEFDLSWKTKSIQPSQIKILQP